MGRTADGEAARAADRLRDQVVEPPLVVLEGAVTPDGSRRVRIGHLAGRGEAGRAGEEVGPEPTAARRVSWIVRADDGPAAVRVVVRSGTGGTARSGWLRVR